MAEGVAARGAAVDLLNAVLGEGRMLAELPEPELPPGERARARRLTESVLRRVEPADRLLDRHLRKAPPLGVRNILRLAVVEMALGAPAHGVVNAAVTLTRKNRKSQHLSGLVNAVLRAVDPQALVTAPMQKLPRWLRQPLVHAYGREAVAAMEAVFAAAPPVDLTLRDGALPPQGEALPTGSIRLHDPGQISALPGYQDGGWWVQDMAAALPARMLEARPGESVLDLCAAPGGKTMQLAAAGAEVTALDISAARMKRLAENLARTGLSAKLITADALAWQSDTLFDAILLDAPCSASGTLRRHPDLPFVKDGSEVAGLAELQARLIDRALTWLKPGGRLVFATCSLLPEEGEAQLAAALDRHPGLRVERPTLAGVAPEWWQETGGLRLRPDYLAERGGMDGFFMARLRNG
ncbi:RsmB/NOP family class I SAM-dependent RNA methyltransferase [Pseudogemmobacter humi]|uniref:Ribosomal RNA small subunit methyltransferase B n=1 Tax=Pseudogemmobacter humi TaxID=2483812 RepID=A0A3P5X8I9_9RHOB|nr:RsmB/NOP family class I SAM-dependent RNA methyltransferase [Pseudogemmobacter humi]VDC23704.1 Ribosomal RNA small subunit methyltransferase B [Pseudogemmobacter humi]